MLRLPWGTHNSSGVPWHAFQVEWGALPTSMSSLFPQSVRAQWRRYYTRLLVTSWQATTSPPQIRRPGACHGLPRQYLCKSTLELPPIPRNMVRESRRFRGTQLKGWRDSQFPIIPLQKRRLQQESGRPCLVCSPLCAVPYSTWRLLAHHHRLSHRFPLALKFGGSLPQIFSR